MGDNFSGVPRFDWAKQLQASWSLEKHYNNTVIFFFSKLLKPLLEYFNYAEQRKDST